jgi:hypothetical protein
MRKITPFPFAGDILMALILSIVGYLTHYANLEAFSWRWLSTFLPFCLGWILAATSSGLYSDAISGHPWQAAWRAGIAAGLAAPFAAMLRGVYLNAAVSPLFMVVLSACSALGFGVWRCLWAWFGDGKKAHG